MLNEGHGVLSFNLALRINKVVACVFMRYPLGQLIKQQDIPSSELLFWNLVKYRIYMWSSNICPHANNEMATISIQVKNCLQFYTYMSLCFYIASTHCDIFAVRKNGLKLNSAKRLSCHPRTNELMTFIAYPFITGWCSAKYFIHCPLKETLKEITSKVFVGSFISWMWLMTCLVTPRIIQLGIMQPWLPFRRRHFQTHFLEWKYSNVD